MKAYAEKLYKSREWQKVRNLYMTSAKWICERCGQPATICLHKKYVTQHNINNPEITLNMENLEALCRECHEKEHSRNKLYARQSTGIGFDEKGNIVKKADVFIVVGAPGSGKTRYVKQHKGAKDLVLDLDYICAALMLEEEIYLDHESVLAVALEIRETIYKCVERRKGGWQKCWIITSTADMTLVRLLSFRLKGEIVKLETPLERCIENIQRDERRGKQRQLFERLAREWFKPPVSKVELTPVVDRPPLPTQTSLKNAHARGKEDRQ